MKDHGVRLTDIKFIISMYNDKLVEIHKVNFLYTANKYEVDQSIIPFKVVGDNFYITYADCQLTFNFGKIERPNTKIGTKKFKWRKNGKE
jgi:hypothetical protein